MKVKVAQSCPTLCNPMDNTAYGILKARLLEWETFPFVRGSSQPREWTQVSPHCRGILYQLSHKVKVKSLGRVQLFVTHQAPPSMGFSRQEYWSGLPFPSPGDLPDPGIKPRSPALQADALTSAPPGKPQGKPKNTRVGTLIPSPGDLPNPGIELRSPALQVDSFPTTLSGKPFVRLEHVK